MERTVNYCCFGICSESNMAVHKLNECGGMFANLRVKAGVLLGLQVISRLQNQSPWRRWQLQGLDSVASLNSLLKLCPSQVLPPNI